SVKTGRIVEEVADEPPGWSSKTGRLERPEAQAPTLPKKARKAGWPGFIEPARATLKPSAPSGARWIHEIKFDGYRLQAHIRGGGVEFLTRSGLDWTAKFGDRIAAALAALPVSEAIVDGELVVDGPSGASDFSAL